MRVINVTRGHRLAFPDYGTMLRLYRHFGNRLWRARVTPLGDGLVLTWEGE